MLHVSGDLSAILSRKCAHKSVLLVKIRKLPSWYACFKVPFEQCRLCATEASGYKAVCAVA